MLAEQVRSGLVETFHQGAVAVVDPDGSLVAYSGEIDRPFFFRSAAKPFQAAVSNHSGAGLTREWLALACASHDGEPVHVALTGRILARAGLDEDHLRCPPSWPLRPEAARRLANGGARQPRRIWHNCSGKHAAMLSACVASNWDLGSYLDPRHPLQVAIRDYMVAVSGPVDTIGIDGCGAPVFQTTARQMARAFARLGSDPDLEEVFDAMHAFPALVSGTGNVDTEIAIALDAAAKRGAEGNLGVAVRKGYGIAIKIWDGSNLVAGMAMVAALEALDLLSPVAGDQLTAFRKPLVKGGGMPVGSFRVRLELRWE